MQILKRNDHDDILIISQESLESIYRNELQQLYNIQWYKRLTLFFTIATWGLAYARIIYRKYQVKQELREFNKLESKIRKDIFKENNSWKNINQNQELKKKVAEELDNCIICFSAPGKFLFLVNLAYDFLIF